MKNAQNSRQIAPLCEKGSQPLLRDAARSLGSGELYNALGVALALQGKGQPATEAFRQAVARDPDRESYRANLERAEAAGPQGSRGAKPDLPSAGPGRGGAAP